MQIGHREEFLVLWKLFMVAILPLETQFIQPNYPTYAAQQVPWKLIPTFLSQSALPHTLHPSFLRRSRLPDWNSKITVGSLLAKLSYWAFLGQVCINLREKKDILSPVSHFFTSILQSTVRKKIYESIICMFILSPWRPYLFSTYFDYVKNL